MKLDDKDVGASENGVTGIRIIMGSTSSSNGTAPPDYDMTEGHLNYGLDVLDLDTGDGSSPEQLSDVTDMKGPGRVGLDDEDISLQYTRHERLPMKNFSAENRGFADVQMYIRHAQLLLDVHETNMEQILDKMLARVFANDDTTMTRDEAKRELFTHDSAHQLCKTIQGTCPTSVGGVDYDQSWLCVLCTLPTISKRHVVISRLKHPANLGRTSQEVYFIILVVVPTKLKGTKNALETGRTFATLFSDVELRFKLQSCHTTEEFNRILWAHMQTLGHDQGETRRKSLAVEGIEMNEGQCFFGRGLYHDLKRRLPHYISDYRDGFVGPRTIQKTISTTFFLYFACLLPSIALGVLNDTNTKHIIGVKEVIWSQFIGGLFFAIFGGQPMVILLTTAPLALYTKVVYTICDDLGFDFTAVYALVGIWNGFFLLMYSLFGASRVMAWSTRSTEEIFALFISIAFTHDAILDISENFNVNYDSDVCNGIESDVMNGTTLSAFNMSNNSVVTDDGSCPQCLRENSLLFLLLTLGTVWLGLTLVNFTKTPFLNASKREILADYALPVAVLIMSFIGSYVFRKVDLEPFNYDSGTIFELASFESVTWQAVLVSAGLGFCLSLLFFMDQNISAAMVASPENKLKKGTTYHWDLLVVAVLNVGLTLFGLPMMHGALPHSPLHVKAMADLEDRVDSGHVCQTVVHVRETRITPILSHILIGLSILLLPYPLQYIPRGVLDGLFIYLAVTALGGNQMFDRILLLFTEQSAYPPNHYIRSVPQRKMHLFTFMQIVQLALMCGIGFSPFPYLKMTFPVLILLLLPIRHKLVPNFIEAKHLKAIDGH